MKTSSKHRIRCPICKKETVWSKENPYRPFCSKRCKMADLGAWLAESYRLDAPTQADYPEENERKDCT